MLPRPRQGGIAHLGNIGGPPVPAVIMARASFVPTIHSCSVSR